MEEFIAAKKCLPLRLKAFLTMVDENQSIRLCETWKEENDNLEIFSTNFSPKTFNSCQTSCNQLQYIGEKTFTKSSNDNPYEFPISYIFPNNQVQITEEYKMFGVNDLIGTIGGHSGLFIGFSFYGFINTILGYIQRRL